MRTIIVGTTNKAKLEQIRGVLVSINVAVEGIESKTNLPAVVEDGETAQKNARKKAVAYAGALGQSVLSMDNALYLEGLQAEDQPGTHVRRILGNNKATDEEMLFYYQELIRTLGGKINGYWEFAVCFANPEGDIYETIIRTPRVFTDQRCDAVVEGYPLESIQIDPENGMYFADMSLAEQTVYWQKTIGSQLCVFVQSVLHT